MFRDSSALVGSCADLSLIPPLLLLLFKEGNFYHVDSSGYLSELVNNSKNFSGKSCSIKSWEFFFGVRAGAAHVIELRGLKEIHINFSGEFFYREM